MFTEGQKVICINDHFPVIKEYGGTGKSPINFPQKGEVLIIDEILGEFLRFNKYDTLESFNWWIETNFSNIDEVKESISIENKNEVLI